MNSDSKLQLFVTEASDSELRQAAEAHFGAEAQRLDDPFDHDKFRDGPLSGHGDAWIVVGDLTDEAAAYVSAKGAIWCKTDGAGGLHRHLRLIDAEGRAGEETEIDLGMIPPAAAWEKPSIRPRPSGEDWRKRLFERVDAELRKPLWRKSAAGRHLVRMLVRSAVDLRLWLLFAALMLVLIMQTLITNSLPIEYRPWSGAEPQEPAAPLAGAGR
jgi:hypothetical protein